MGRTQNLIPCHKCKTSIDVCHDIRLIRLLVVCDVKVCELVLKLTPGLAKVKYMLSK